MRFFSFLIVTLLYTGVASAQTITNRKVKAGDAVSESVPYSKDKTTTGTYELPNNTFTLLYRFGDLTGDKDNFDSLHAVVNHVYRLNRFFGPRKRSRLTLYIYVKEVNDEALELRNKIRKWNRQIGDSLVKTNRAGFNFSREWEILYIKTSDIKESSVFNAGKLTVISVEGTVEETSPIRIFHYGEKKGSIKGKLLTEKQGRKLPLSNVLVSLFKTGIEQPDSALTNDYGDFELPVPDEKGDYAVVVKNPPKDVGNIILATQTGQEVSRLKKTNKGFEYKMIPTDIVLLSEVLEDEDISLVFKKFGTSKEKDLKVTENILYALGQFNIEEDSKEILDKVVKIMRENPMVKLEVVSHTDAQGEDKGNLLLSEKRSKAVIDYLILNGVHQSRLKALGMGEKEIRNRCGNGVDCSDKEHGYNRRTEFRFSKSKT